MPRRSLAGETLAVSRSSSQMRARRGGSIIRLIMRRTVVLPQPDGPTKHGDLAGRRHQAELVDGDRAVAGTAWSRTRTGSSWGCLVVVGSTGGQVRHADASASVPKRCDRARASRLTIMPTSLQPNFIQTVRRAHDTNHSRDRPTAPDGGSGACPPNGGRNRRDVHLDRRSHGDVAVRPGLSRTLRRPTAVPSVGTLRPTQLVWRTE